MIATKLPDPRKSQVVLIGVSEHTDPRLPGYQALQTGVKVLARLLQCEGIWGVPEAQCRVVTGEDATQENISQALIDAAKAAEDALVVYYGGHGVLDRQGTITRLLLAPRAASYEHTFNWRDFDWLRSHLQYDATMAKHRVLLLDSCHSGEAVNRGTLNGPAGPWQEDDRASLSTLITSCEKFERAKVPESGRYSEFVSALVKILSTGVDGAGEALTPEHLYNGLRSQIGGQTPRMLCADGATTMPLFKNRQHGAAPPGSDSESMPTIEPGRYPDPADTNAQSDWDGRTWVEMPIPPETAPPAATPDPEEQPAREPVPTPHREITRLRRASRSPRPPVKRPSSVTVAVLVQWLLAIALLISGVAGHVYAAYFHDAYDAELARQLGGPHSPESSTPPDYSSASTLVFSIIVAAILVVLAQLNAAGKRLGRILTWIFQLLVLLFGGFAFVSVLLYVPSLQWAFDHSDNEQVQALDAAALMDAAFGVYPSWIVAVGWTMVALALLGSLLVITMLAVPVANAFFRMEKPSQHLPDAPRVPNGSRALRDRLFPLGPRGRLVIVFWRAMLDRGKRLVNGKAFLILGIAALMIGALVANATWSAFRTESTNLAATAEEASAVGQCLPYDPKVEGRDLELIDCDAPEAFWEITAQSYDIDATGGADGLEDNQAGYELCGEDYGALRPGEPWTIWHGLTGDSDEVENLYCLKALGNPNPESDAHTPYAPDEGTCIDREGATWTVDCGSPEADFKVVDAIEFDEPRELSDDEVEAEAHATCDEAQYYKDLVNFDDRVTMILCLNDL